MDPRNREDRGLMRQVISDQLGDFATIYEENLEIVSVARPQARNFVALARQLIHSHQFLRLQWVQPADSPDAPKNELPSTIDADTHTALCDEIAEASEILGELMGCKRAGIRLESLNAPMCPRFHADHVPCRMLMTIIGLATEWIPNSDVDWAVFADLDTMAPPIQANRSIQQLTTGHWSILKGGAWQDSFGGVVHRSPHGTGERLLLTLDPIF